ncbi:hypothetical protein NPIL_244621 [Nephila pilipes]|uniref:Uncharacterized protein n=1 Tax=Nephila pilipes TaxID=299642 RepID=A0A8X6NIJ7_NEPPI|nr:hypothetical protein NPIL_244621 [Nephila pilipes]
MLPIRRWSHRFNNQSERSTQNVAKCDRSNHPYAFSILQGSNLTQVTDLLYYLADILNKSPGFSGQLTKIAAVKDNKSQNYAAIGTLLESESSE